LRHSGGNTRNETRLYAGRSENPELQLDTIQAVTTLQVQKISREVDAQAFDPSETTRRAPSEGEIKSYLQGALHDASLNKGKRYRFTQSNRGWLETLQTLLQSIGYRSWIYKEGKMRTVHTLETLATFLNFKFDPTGLELEEKIAYVRGFFDAEGGIPRVEDREVLYPTRAKRQTETRAIEGNFIGSRHRLRKNPQSEY
jgi:hypothetical protein